MARRTSRKDDTKAKIGGTIEQLEGQQEDRDGAKSEDDTKAKDD